MPAAKGSYYIGSLPAITSLDGKAIPSTDQYALCVGIGPRKMSLTWGAYGDEKTRTYIFEGSLQAILSPTPLGARLRKAFTFLCYPRVGAQNMWAGIKRIEPQTLLDGNRIWATEGSAT